jgi:YHS domain-containing protein
MAKKEKIKCPVCGMDVDQDSQFKASHADETYYFCSEEDKKEFQDHPSKYVRKEKAA